MNIVIATFSKYDNYGSRLQNYAICRALEKLGVNANTILPYDLRECAELFLKMVLSYLPPIYRGQKYWINERKKRKVFAEFNKSLHLKQIKYRLLVKLDETTDAAIAGSDQIWNPQHLLKYPKDIDFFFLNFVSETKRFAYAPSFGNVKIPKEIEGIYGKRLREFNLLSAREVNGQRLIKELIGQNVSVMPDPVFLLSKEEWGLIAKDCKPDGNSLPYVLVYFLSNHRDSTYEHIYQYANEKNLEVIKVAGNEYSKGEITPTPQEFVALISDAKAVFTDSFHGTVLSIIMNTLFVIFDRTDVKQFSRIDSLLREFDLENAYCKESDLINYDEIFNLESFESYNRSCQQVRQKGTDFLREIIRSSNGKAPYTGRKVRDNATITIK